jgi:dinuclear metal center YbgI/SA1388 family protein
VTALRATVGDCVDVLEGVYDPAWAASWDAVGLTVGDLDATVDHVLFAVDPTVDVAAQAVAIGANLLVTHHPLFLRGVHGVAGTSPGGRVVATLIRGGVALYTAHTNADVAAGGVSDALAAALGLGDVTPLSAATPRGGDEGLGRIGALRGEESVREFCARVAGSLPATAAGVRATGDPDRAVSRVAVCGGAGGEVAAAAAAAGADVLLTADQRHHHTLDAVAAHGALTLVDVAHWASEWPWLPVAARRLTDGLAARGRTVDSTVSRLVTDPWRWRFPDGGTVPGGIVDAEQSRRWARQ